MNSRRLIYPPAENHLRESLIRSSSESAMHRIAAKNAHPCPLWVISGHSAKTRRCPLYPHPTTGIAGCCAHASSGHAAPAPPTSAMNSPRLIRSPHRRGRVALAALRGRASTRCPLYPQKRTWIGTAVMSALCQKRTHALQQKGLLFDRLVGARVQDEKEADRSTLRRYSIGGDDDVIE